MKLSILIASVPCRIKQLHSLVSKLNEQIFKAQAENEVEVICIMDSKTITVGEKRNMLKKMATGDYIAYIDDDDDISFNYIEEILNAIKNNKDIITFQVCYYKDGKLQRKWFLSLHMGEFETEAFQFRKINHLCPHKRSIANTIDFPHINFKEDVAYWEQLEKKIQSTSLIEKVLYHYHFSTTNTQTQNGTATAFRQD